MDAHAKVRLVGKAEWGPGVHDDWPSWWLLYGTAVTDASVTLADGRQPEILPFGSLWICEWVSTTQPAKVSITGDLITIFDRVPGYIQRMNEHRG